MDVEDTKFKRLEVAISILTVVIAITVTIMVTVIVAAVVAVAVAVVLLTAGKEKIATMIQNVSDAALQNTGPINVKPKNI